MYRLLTASLLLLSAGVHGRANDPGTDDPDADAPSEAATQLDRIQVVGSRIPRIDFEGPLPITVIERAEIEASGRSTLSDLLRDLPFNSFGTELDAPNFIVPGQRLLNLRGLGPQYTVVLLDGQRLPGFSGAAGGASTSVAGLPLTAIERVEVLRDGASAVYGSEAIGGVVNLITRRGEQAPTFGVQFDQPSEGGGRMRAASAFIGRTQDRGDWMLGLQLSTREPLLATQRPYLLENAPLSINGAPSSYRSFDPATGMPVGPLTPDPRCPARPGESSQFPSSGLLPIPGVGAFCGYRFRDDNFELTGLDSAAVFAGLRRDLPGTTRLDGRLMLWRNQGETQLAPSPGGLTIAPDNPINPTLGALGPGLGYRLTVPYRLTPLGPRRTESEDDNLHAALRLSGQWRDADWQLGLQHNRQTLESNGSAGYALSDVVNRQVASGAFDPFSAVPGEPGVLAAAIYAPWQQGRTRSDGLDAGLNLFPFELAAGPVELALGASARRDRYQTRFDPQSQLGNVIGSPGNAETDAGRTHMAVYVEAMIPLAGGWEANLALRYDHYQDAGNALSPRLAVAWRPSERLLLRGAVGRGFRVVDLEAAYAATSRTTGFVTDYLRCAEGVPLENCQGPADIDFLSSPSVDPERARQEALGLVWQPGDGFSLGVDLYRVRLRDQIGRLTPDEVLRFELACQQGGTDCDPSRVGEVLRDAIGAVALVRVPLVNIAAMRTRGIDFDLSQRSELGPGSFAWSLRVSRVLQFEQQLREESAVEDPLGYAAAPRLRATLATDYSVGRHALHANVRFIDGYRACDFAGYPDCDQRIRSHTEIDLRWALDLGRHGTLALGMRNASNRQPPLNPYSLFGDLPYGLYDIVGRVPYLRYERGL